MTKFFPSIAGSIRLNIKVFMELKLFALGMRLFVVLFCFVANFAIAQTGGTYTYSSGAFNISAGANWSELDRDNTTPGIQAPTAADKLNVYNGATLTVDISDAICGEIHLGVSNSGNGTLKFISGSLLTLIKNPLYGSVFFGDGNSQGSLDMSLGGTMKISGNNIPNWSIGTFNPGAGSSGGTIIFNGADQQISGSDENFNNVELTNGSAFSNVTKSVGASNSDGSVNISGNLVINGGVTLSAGATTIKIAGNWTNNGTFNAGSGVVNFNGSNQTVTGSNAFNGLTSSGAGTLALPDYTPIKNLILQSGILSGGPNRYINISTGGTVQGNGGTFSDFLIIQFVGSATVSGTVTFPLAMIFNGAVDFGPTSTIKYTLQLGSNVASVLNNAPYYANGSQLIYAGGNMTRGLEWSSSSGKGYPSDVLVISTGATLNMGTTDAQCSGNLYVTTNNGPTTLNLSSTNNTLTVLGNIYLDGTLNLNNSKIVAKNGFGAGGTLNAGTGTVEFGGTGTQTIPALNYYNLTSSSTGGRILASNSTIGIGGMFTPGGNVYTITGSTIDFNAAGAQTIPAFTYNNLVLSNATTTFYTKSLTGNITVAGNLLINQYNFLAAGANTITSKGDFQVNGGFFSGTGTVVFNGTTDQNVFNGGSFYNLTINSDAKVNSTQGIGVSRVLTLQKGLIKSTVVISDGGAIVGAGGGFDLTYEFPWVTFGGSATVSGAVIFKDVNLPYTGSVDFGLNSTVTGILTVYPNSGSPVINNAPYYAVGSSLRYFNPAAPNFSFTRGLEWSATSGKGYPFNVIIANNATVNIGSTGGQCAGYFQINSGSTFNLGASNNNNLIVGSNVVNAGTINAGDGMLTLAGNFVNNGIFNAGTGTVEFNGNTDQILSGNAPTLNNLKVKSLGTLSLQDQTAIKNLILESGYIKVLSGGQFIRINNGGSIQGNGGDFASPDFTVLIFDGSANVSGTVNFRRVSMGAGAAVDFGNNSTIVVDIQLMPGASVVNNAPFYANNSTLIYFAPQGSYDRGLEWSSNSGKGYPYNIYIRQLNTTLNIGNGNAACAGSIQIYDAILNVGAGILTINKDVAISSGTLNFSSGLGGNLVVKGNWQNYGNFNAGTGTVTFSGTSPQTVSGNAAAVFNNLIINNSTGVTVNQTIIINGVLTLTNGIVTNNNAIVRIGSSGSISDASLSSYIDGELQRSYSTVGPKDFPIGKGGNYRPLTLTYTSLVGTPIIAAQQIESGFQGTFPSGFTQLGTRYWRVTEVAPSTSHTYDITLDGTGTNPTGAVKILKYHYFPAPVSNDLYGTTGANSYTATGLTSFSDFALGEQNCIPPSNALTGSNSPICSGSSLNLTSSASGTAPLNYSWSGPNNFNSAEQNPTILNATAAAGGQYTVTMTNSCGSVQASTFVTINNPSTFYKDNDGDGYGNESITAQGCSAPQGYVTDHSDCDDDDATVNPKALEVCDGKDNNCDGQIDEDCPIVTSPNIYTIAGNGIQGYSGDGGPGVDAKLNEPFDAVVDAAGNIYIADQSDHRIRKLSPSGIITTFAGTGVSGFNGDGIQATSAQLAGPAGLAIDGAGNIYIAEQSNHRIRKINSSGIISTVVGTGTRGYSGDGGLATSAQLNTPLKIALDAAGNLYISDWGNSVVRKVNTAGIITTIAGTGVRGYNGDGIAATSAQLNDPSGLAVDAQGNIYIAEESNARVRKINTSGLISTIAGTGVRGYSGDGGLATNAKLNSPEGISIDANGNLYIADNGDSRIRKVSASGIITSIAGTGVPGFSGDGGPATDAQLQYPGSATLDNAGNIIITDDYNHRVRLVGILVPPVVAPPVITSFTPTSGPVGTTVTITGANFNAVPSDNIVYFGAVRATVTSGTTSSLMVTLPAGATYQPISVLDNNTGLTGYSSKAFVTTFNNPFGTGIPANFYKPSVNLPAGSYPFWTSIGDIDGDGKPDLVVANSATNTVSVSRNTTVAGSISSSSFAPPVNFSTGTNPAYVSISDLDGDGKPDLAVVNRGSNTVSVFHNTSTMGSINSNSLAEKVDFTTGAGPYSIDISDLDLDGKPELITANIDDNTVSVLRNASDKGSISSSSFSDKVDFAAGGGNPSIVKTGDLDGDGKPEIVVANYTAYSVSVLQNISTAGTIDASSFAEHFELVPGLTPFSVAIGDLDGDGKPEIAVTNLGSGSVSVFQNTCSPGTIGPSYFANKVDIPTGVYSPSIGISDADGDGKADLIIANQLAHTISVIRNDATPGNLTSASLNDKVDFNTIGEPISIAAADLDGDGVTEVVVSNYGNSVSVYEVGVPAAGALNFDGVNDYVDLGTSFNYQNFTIEMWVKPGATQVTYADIIDNNHTDGQSWVLQQNGNNLNQYYFGGSTGISPTFTLTPGVWQHVAIVSTPNTKTIYVNGLAVVNQTGLPPITYNGSENLRLGRWGFGGRNWNGSMDELRIWNRALCQSEIQHYMNNELPFTSGNGLVSYYKMNSGFVNADNSDKTTLTDETGTNNGALQNFALTGSTSNWTGGHVTGTADVFDDVSANISIVGDGTLTCSNTSVHLTATGGEAFSWSTGETTPSISVTAPGDYTVTVSSSAGCSSIATATISQDIAEPGISVFTPSTVFNCESPGTGNAIALWVWGNGTATVTNSSNILIEPNGDGSWNIGEAGTYTGTVTGANGCISTQQITYTSDFTPPSVTIANHSGTTALSCTVSTISVTASGGRSYSWSGGTSPNTAENSFTEPGVYTVTVTGYNGCIATSSIEISVLEDTTPPTIVCPAAVTINATEGLCTGTTTLIPPTVTDNCSSFGNALSFDGGYVEVPDAPILNPFNEWTLETWVRRGNTNGQESLIEKYGGTYGYMLRIFDNNKAMAGIVFGCCGGYFIEGVTPILPNTWYHLATTFNRTTGVMKLYVNGILEAQVTGMVGLPTQPNTVTLKLGARGDDAGSRLTNGGLMDEVRIWNVERTQAQIQASMNRELGAQSGLVALYHLNEGVASGTNTGSTTAIDASGNGNHGTLINFALTGPTSNWVSGKAFGLTLTNDAPPTYPIGNTNVTWTATDGSGNSATCTQTVTVTDNQPPSIICPAPVTINTSPGLCTGTTTLIPPTVTDNCNSVGNALSFDGGYVNVPDAPILNPFNEWTLETWVRRTNTGVQESLIEKYNQPGDRYGYLLRILDNNKAMAGFLFGSFGGYFIEGVTPILPNTWYHLATTVNRSTGVMKLYVNGILDAQVTGMVGLPTTPNTATLKLGARGDDAATRLTNGGLMDEVRIWNVERTQAQIQAGMNSELSTQSGLVALYHLNQGLAGGTNTGLTTATDVSGNGNNGTLINFALSGPTSNWVSGKTFGLTLTNNAPVTYPKGNTTVTWTATDASGNSAMCTQVVTVVDNQQPVITAPVSGNTNRNTNGGICTYKTVSTEFNATATDNCAVTSLTYQLTGVTTGTGTTLAGVVFNKGVTTVKWTASDGATATVTNSFTVTVVDNQQPVITCPVSGNTNRNTNTGVCTYKAVLTEFNATATDNCAVTSLTYAVTGATTGTGTTLAGVVFNKGVTVVTWTASDGTTANATCSFTVTVVDNEKPVITSCPTVPLQCYNANGTYPVPALTASDNCGVQSMSYSVSGATSRTGNTSDASGLFNPGISLIGWKVVDVSGNTTTCNTTVVIDKVDAVIRDTFPSGITAAIGKPNTIYVGYGGTSVTLTAQVTSSVTPNTFTYKWTIGSPSGTSIGTGPTVTVSPTSTTVYYLSVKDANTCKPLSQVTKQVNVVNIVCGSGKITVCVPQKNGTYASSCVSSAQSSINKLPAGWYLGSCTTTLTVAAKATGTGETSFDKMNVTANPNPTSHSFSVTINSNNAKDRIIVNVLDVLGRLVENKNSITAGQTFKLGENYRPGIYLVEVIQGNERKTLKLIKQ